MPDVPESFQITGEPFVTIGVHRKSVTGGTLESQMYQPAVMVRDDKGADFILGLGKNGMVEIFDPAVRANAGRWEGLSFTAQGSRNADGSYRAILQTIPMSNGNGAEHGR